MGTSIYRAPEVYYQNYDVRADLWSVGMIMLECIAGNKPNVSNTRSLNQPIGKEMY